ncbi:MAG: hypothetical protein GX248_03835 [Peptococcaceae bacterium]|nr:hypothetical protein [Peptococcaceae bacterium]
MFKKAILILLIGLFLLLPAGVYFQTPTTLNATPFMERIEGSTNMETVISIVQRLGGTAASNIVITDDCQNAANFAASVLAFHLDAPILPKSQSAIQYVRQYLTKGGTVWLISSGEVFSDEFAANFAKIKRIEGRDQYETAALIAEQLGKTKTVVICSGENIADALNICSIASREKWPILLTFKNSLPQATKNYLLKSKPQNIYIVGGKGAVSYELEEQIQKLLPSAHCERFQGYNCLETSALVLAKFIPDPKNLYFTCATEYDLALAGSVLAAKTKGALILCNSATIDLPPAIDKYIASLKEPTSIYVLGGQFAVSDETVLSAGQLEQPAVQKTDFVNLAEYIPSLIIDLPYATTNNFTRTQLYSENVAYLRKGTADKLKKAVEELNQKGYRVKIWDAYRPPAVQFKMWNAFPNANFVANPWTGYSDHARGSAVDLTIDNLPMPTDFDEFSSRAYRVNQNKNAQLLEEVMVKHGFVPLASEWWHFTDSDNQEGIYKPVEKVNLAPKLTLRPNIVESITISMIGDVILGQDERFGNFADYYQRYGPQYFFSGVKDILAKDTLTIANLEGALTKSQEKIDKSSQGNRAFWFKGEPAYAEILQAGSIEAVNLANNHSLDYGAEGLKDTITNLKKVGITCFGEEQTAIYGKVGLIGANVLGPVEQGTDISVLKKKLKKQIEYLREKVPIIVVYFHWGTEYQTIVDKQQKELAHFAVDQGAKLVVGSHPHVLQEIEQYKGATIVYSLGNFVFGGNTQVAVKDTVIFQQTFRFLNDRLVEVEKEKLIPCSVSGSKDFNDYRPVKINKKQPQEL